MLALRKIRLLHYIALGLILASLVLPKTVLAATGTSNGSIVISALHIFGANMGLPDTDPRAIVARLIRTAMGFLGIVAVVMILSSGLQLMISGGDEEKVDMAKRAFFNAIIGLIIILSAYSIVAFALNALSTATS